MRSQNGKLPQVYLCYTVTTLVAVQNWAHYQCEFKVKFKLTQTPPLKSAALEPRFDLTLSWTGSRLFYCKCYWHNRRSHPSHLAINYKPIALQKGSADSGVCWLKLLIWSLLRCPNQSLNPEPGFEGVAPVLWEPQPVQTEYLTVTPSNITPKVNGLYHPSWSLTSSCATFLKGPDRDSFEV